MPEDEIDETEPLARLPEGTAFSSAAPICFPYAGEAHRCTEVGQLVYLETWRSAPFSSRAARIDSPSPHFKEDPANRAGARRRLSAAIRFALRVLWAQHGLYPSL